MYFKTTYDQNFDDLYMHLKAKYPDKLFDLDGIGKQMDMSEFSRNFFSAKVTSDASIDANANVDDTSVITYNIELPKPFFRLNSYYILWKELKRLYSLEVANTIIEMQLTGDIYIHDFHGVAAGQVYCFNYSSYDILTKGLPMIKKVKSIPPKHLHAFKSQLEQFVIIASNSTLGATGLADLLVILSYFAKNILSTKSDAHYKFQTEEDCWTYIKEMLISFIYSVNFSLRGNQCVTEDTEVLTPMGFKRYNELKVGDDIYTWDKGRLNIQKVEKVNIYEYDGIMHQYSGRDILQTVTPNHRVLHKKNGSKEYILSESSTIFDRLTPTTIPVSMIFDDRPDYEISDDLLKLAVFILTDGNIKKSDGRSDRISIFKSPMRWGNEELKGILNSLGLEYSLVNKPNGFDNGGSLNHYILNVENSSEILNVLNHTKSELPSWMFNLSKRQANIVIDLWAKLDGNTDTKNYNKKKLQCDNQKIADQLQHICFLSGKGSKIINRVIGENKKPTIYLIPYNRTNKDANKKEEVQYSGKVWCPTTKDGIVVFRKNGGIFISGNSPFTNLSVYDKYFLEKLCGDYLFPDGSSPDVDVVNKLQEIYLDIINAELERTPLTYPITTACFSVDNENNIQDEKFLDLISEKNKKYGFINIYCGKTSTLSSCCRLRSESDNEYFNSFGSGSSKIGSLGVCSINLPRLAIKSKTDKDAFKQDLLSLVNVCSKINNAKRKVIEKRIKNGNEPLYTYEFMDLSRQYSTVGLNGINECIKLMGENILEKDGQNFLIDILDAINLENKKLEKQYNSPHNVEQVPGENMSIKLAEKDKLMGYQNEYNIYSNQFIPLTTNADLLDRIYLQGLFDKHFTGGAICHINVESRIDDTEKIKELIRETAKQGVIYHAINYNLQECEEGHMTVGKKEICSICGTKIVNDYSRIVGFLTNTKNWAKVRRDEDYPNRVWYKDI